MGKVGSQAEDVVTPIGVPRLGHYRQTVDINRVIEVGELIWTTSRFGRRRGCTVDSYRRSEWFRLFIWMYQVGGRQAYVDER